MIGAGNHQDAVAGVVIHDNAGRSCSVMAVREDVCGVYAMFPIIMDCAFTEHVTANFGDDGRLRAQSGRHHRLVSSLAAESKVKRLPNERFSGLRQSRRSKSQINVAGTDDTNARLALGHLYVSR